MHGPAQAGTPAQQSARPTGERIAELYERVLRVGDVRQDDDFFVLGGTSLSAIELLDTITDELGVRVPVGDFYRATGVAELADVVDARVAERAGGV
ncbi:phosphopantetheine-binding protein [Streptomyces spinosirectus]|uniref:acyl carrier protein n=1 Tax=Streptomyces TaxID=1883 RepID=UPI000D497B8F|nr:MULTISPECIES: acyl carrier protein [Streptomyces]MBY8338858.1 acyl carrier protein [Streptomyces plumbidurans]PTN00380.1 acyl carrier protein [Streptomyces sp. VMFN-G11Ma]UIR20960.1 phosphopantetheine-binding protein [Streptomyces spinosirectus]